MPWALLLRVTEGRFTNEMLQHFSHAVCDFEKPPADSFDAGNEAGQPTDNFSIMVCF